MQANFADGRNRQREPPYRRRAENGQLQDGNRYDDFRFKTDGVAALDDQVS